MRLVVGVTGASGAIYGIRMLEVCRDLGVETHLIMSDWARYTIQVETDYRVEEVEQLASFTYRPGDLAAGLSSGSFRHQGMVVIPCSMKSLAAIAHGFGSTLLHRAADVTLKERRPLVVVPRESPFSIIHLENMLVLARAGAVILPPAPAFYHRPATVRDLVDATVARVLDHFGVEHALVHRWGEPATRNRGSNGISPAIPSGGPAGK